ncbi:MAG: hypothetical protein RML40_08175 [Bacteroidota bacterium]|nr:hypothetical protein [Bacteroidota bacterium]
MKRRQRLVEYIALSTLQGILAVGLLQSTSLIRSVELVPLVFAGAWLLAQLREKRRTMGQHDTKRLLGDTIESFCLALTIALALILAQWFTVGIVVAMTYFAVSLLAYLLGSFFGELWWTSRVLPRYDLEHKINYVTNLNRSVIFPYNLRYLRSMFREQPSSSMTRIRSLEHREDSRRV